MRTRKRFTLAHLVGLVGGLFARPGRATPVAESNETIKVVLAYAAAMSAPHDPVQDAANLPYPKSRIKQALLAALGLATQNSMRDELKAAYVSLADWQEGAAVLHAGDGMAERMAAEADQLRAELQARGL